MERPPARSAGLIEDKHAACPSGTAANFTYNYGPVAAGNVTNLFAQAAAAPAAGTSWVIHLSDNGTSVLTCTVGAGATSCSAAGPVAIAAGHFLQVQATTANGAGATGWKVVLNFGS